MSIINDNFDPNGVGIKDANIFGLPTKEENSDVIIIPVPWEVTVSYRTGTIDGPQAILDESLQVDLYDPEFKDEWKNGYYMLPINEEQYSINKALRKEAELVIEHLYNGSPIEEEEKINSLRKLINEKSNDNNDWVYHTSKNYLDKGKKIALLGGDHSTPFGIIKAIAEKYNNIGVLQIDAHADLRKAYEGFTYSHASIMYNVLNEIPQVNKLVQVGIRDYCDEELELIESNTDRIKTFFDRDIKHRMYEGETWSKIVDNIISELPPYIYISFDIDGLDPKLCPNTGTPVPGGFELEQVFYLFKKIREAGIKIVSFDINEVSIGTNPDISNIDPITGARLLYKLCNYLSSENL